jgi:type I restriction enzyme S subunit
VRAQQFILSRIDARHGALGLIPEALDGAVVSNDFPVFTPSASRLLPSFLAWISKTNSFVDICRAASEGTTNRVRLDEQRFLTFEIPLPSLDEQRCIVARIEALASQIEEARGLRRGAVEEAEALLANVISSLPFDESKWTGLGSTVTNKKGAARSGPFGSQLLHEEFVETGIAAIGSRDVQVNRFEHKSRWFVSPVKFEELERYRVFPDDLLVTIIGGSIGRFCLFPADGPKAFTTNHVVALTLDLSVAHPRFLSYMLNFHTRCRETIFSQTEGSAQPSLNIPKVLAIEVPLPHYEEQKEITAYLDIIQSRIDTLKQLQANTQVELDALLPSILDRAFRGEL